MYHYENLKCFVPAGLPDQCLSLKVLGLPQNIEQIKLVAAHSVFVHALWESMRLV